MLTTKPPPRPIETHFEIFFMCSQFLIEGRRTPIVFSTKALQILHGLDLSTRVAVVTGANSGIGFEISRSLALHGCRVVLACRNFNRAEQAAGKIRSERPNSRCFPMKLDLGCLVSVRNFAAEFLTRFESLDMLVLNAGVFGLDFSRTVDDLETTFQV